jgi:integrase/recombinase XerD
MAKNEGALDESAEWFLDHLRVQRGASAHTVEAYRRDIESASEFFARSGLSCWSDLTPQAVTRFQASLGPPTAPATAQRRMSALRSFLKFLKKQGEGPAMDLPSTGGFRKRKAIPRALSAAQLESLLAVPDVAKPDGLRDRALLELVYGAGLRVSEALGLTFSDVDLDSLFVRVTGKRGKARVVPLPRATAGWIERYIDAGRPRLVRRPSSLLFLSARGLPLRRTTFALRLKDYSRAAGLGTIGPHVLRHTYAVHLLRGGADLRAVQELLGHASLSSTQVYTQLDMEEVRKAHRLAHPRG